MRDALVLLLALAGGAAGRPHFSGGDLEDKRVWRSLLAWAVERQVVLVTTNESGLPSAVGTLLQMRTLGVVSTLVHATSKAVCDALYASVPDGACAWTSWKPAGVVGEWRPTNLRTVLFTARKYIVQRLAVGEGMGVLQTDTDAVWFVNPFELFDAPSLRRFDIIVQRDAPLVNAGIMYVRNARNGTGAAYVVDELLRTLQRFSGEAGAVLREIRQVVPNARSVAHKVDNEQMHLNDIVASATLGARTWHSSIWRLYGADGEPCYRAACDETGRLEYARMVRAVNEAGREARLDLCVPASPLPSLCELRGATRGAELDLGTALSIADPTLPAGRPPTSSLLLAPPALFAHVLQLRKLISFQRETRCAKLAALRAARGAELGAARGSDAWAAEARRVAPVVAMVHLSMLASHKHQRSAVVQAFGSWDARADSAGAGLVAPRLRGAQMRVLTLGNFDLYALLAAQDTREAQLKVIRPLVLLARLTGRRPALPPLPCAVGAAAPARHAAPAAARAGRAAAGAAEQPSAAPPKVRRTGQLELFVPNSDCGAPVAGDASGVPAVGGECIFLSTVDCHRLIFSQFELSRVRAADRGGEVRVALRDLADGRGGARGFRERASRLLGAHLDAPIITIDGGGAPLSALAEAIGLLPDPASQPGEGAAFSEIAEICRAALKGCAGSANATYCRAP